MSKKPHQLRLWRFAPVITLLCVSCGWVEKPNLPMPLAKSATLDVYVVSPTNVPASRKDTNPATGNMIFLLTPPVISAKDVVSVQRSGDSDRLPPSLAVNLTPAGAKKLAAATTPARGQQVAVVLNGTVVSVPKVESPLSANFVVTGGPIGKDFDTLFNSLTGQ